MNCFGVTMLMELIVETIFNLNKTVLVFRYCPNSSRLIPETLELNANKEHGHTKAVLSSTLVYISHIGKAD